MQQKFGTKKTNIANGPGSLQKSWFLYGVRRARRVRTRGAWDDPLHVILPRWRAIGMVGPVALLLVVHANPNPRDDERIRIIGARKATRRERQLYEEGAQPR